MTGTIVIRDYCQDTRVFSLLKKNPNAATGFKSLYWPHSGTFFLRRSALLPGSTTHSSCQMSAPGSVGLCQLLPALLASSLWLVPTGWCQDEQAAQTPDWRMTLKTIRNGVHKIDVYLNAALDLLGGDDGLCQFKCNDGFKPFPRYGYKPAPPNGCGSEVFGVHFDVGIPSMTKCCNQHDRCYDTCGNKKNECDEEFQTCLSRICRGVQKTLGISQSVEACESTVELLFRAVIHLGCKPYLDSQRASCMCRYEEKVDL